MKLIFVSLTIVLLAAFIPLSQAKQSTVYVVAGAGYATNNINNYQHDEVTFKLNVGYVLSKQWSVEIGYNGLGDSGLNNNQLAVDNANFETNDYNITAFRLSALGRARNQHGELFYRVGVMQVNAQRTYALDDTICEGNDALIATFSTTSVCQSDNDQIAGVIGLGFDFNMTDLTQLRVEIEHIQGQDDYSAQALLLGLRVNF
jgi:hypothetical protein